MLEDVSKVTAVLFATVSQATAPLWAGFLHPLRVSDHIRSFHRSL